MLGFFQRRKVLNLHEAAHYRICKILTPCTIAQNISFETAVFLYSSIAIAFDSQEQVVDDITSVTAHFVVSKAETPAQRKEIKRRMAMYELAASGAIMPRAFWSLSDVSEFMTQPLTRAVAMYGDFLVNPECTHDYEDCPWPLFDIFANTLFSQAFMNGVLPEITSFMENTAAVVFR